MTEAGESAQGPVILRGEFMAPTTDRGKLVMMK